MIPVGDVVPKPWAVEMAKVILHTNPKPGHCHMCDAKVEYFKDELSLREYHISGMCQECQDKTFNMTEEDEP